jgi:hypothetical protein
MPWQAVDGMHADDLAHVRAVFLMLGEERRRVLDARRIDIYRDDLHHGSDHPIAFPSLHIAHPLPTDAVIIAHVTTAANTNEMPR